MPSVACITVCLPGCVLGLTPRGAAFAASPPAHGACSPPVPSSPQGVTMATSPSVRPAAIKKDADHVFHELTRSICPDCRRVIDAQVLIRDGGVFMRKRCPDHGPFEALVYADAEAYVRN